MLRGELRETGDLLEHRLELLVQQQASPVSAEPGSASDPGLRERSRAVFAALERDLRQRLDTLREQRDRLERLRERLDTAYQQRATQDLLAREPFVLFAPDQWPATVVELSNAPRILAHQIWLSVESVLKAVTRASIEQWFALAGSILLLAVLVALGRRYLAHLSERHTDGEDDSFASKFTHTLARLLRKNLWGIALAGALALALWWLRVPQPGLSILLTLVLLWVGVKTPLDLAWLLLAAPGASGAYRNPRFTRWCSG